MDDPYRDPMGSYDRRARYEYHLAKDFTIPFLKHRGFECQNASVLDLGCGSGGLMIALAESGASCLGIDRSNKRLDQAKKRAHEKQVGVEFVLNDILQLEDLEDRFDLVVLSEVLEHLHNLSNVEKVLRWAERHLLQTGTIYVSFPPWYNPFAGHQAGWPRIRYIPWFHLLSEKGKNILAPGHAQKYLKFAEELNHLTIKSFEACVRQAGLSIVRRALFHLRPEYH
jgi:2-polyprenyl-3-methyl-5-hydroxy-6-metoxy-1,4-benzoquinol methylase